MRSTERPLWLGQREAAAGAGPAASDPGEGAAARGVLGRLGWSRGGTSPGPDGVLGSSRGAGRAGALRGPLPGPGRAGGTRGSGGAGPFCSGRAPRPAGAAVPALRSRLCPSRSPVAPCRPRRCPCAAGPRSAAPEPRPGRAAGPSAAAAASSGSPETKRLLSRSFRKDVRRLFLLASYMSSEIAYSTCMFKLFLSLHQLALAEF